MADRSPTVVSILTPPGRGAVAVVAVAGPRAGEFVQQYFQPAGRALTERQPTEIVFGRWQSAADAGLKRSAPEDVIVVCREADSWEVHCHGGQAAISRIVEDLVFAGATQQPWQQWIGTGEGNSIRAAARRALAEATTLQVAGILLDQYHGALETELRAIVAILTGDSCSDAQPASAALDRTHRCRLAQHNLKQLLARAAVGLHLTTPWSVVAAGPPNVGKSSLINALVGYQRSIVFDQPGTTRDVVTAQAALSGWPVEFADTAGLSQSNEPLEAAGVEKARQQAAGADCLLLVYDISQPYSDEIRQLSANYPDALLVGNKSDLLAAHRQAAEAGRCLPTCALTGAGIDALIDAIVARLIPLPMKQGEAVPFLGEQVAGLRLALESVQSGDAATACQALLALLA